MSPVDSEVRTCLELDSHHPTPAFQNPKPCLQFHIDLDQMSPIQVLYPILDQKVWPAHSLEPHWGRASRLQRCSGSADTEQDLFQTVIATSKVFWATTAGFVLTIEALEYQALEPLHLQQRRFSHDRTRAVFTTFDLRVLESNVSPIQVLYSILDRRGYSSFWFRC